MDYVCCAPRKMINRHFLKFNHCFQQWIEKLAEWSKAKLRKVTMKKSNGREFPNVTLFIDMGFDCDISHANVFWCMGFRAIKWKSERMKVFSNTNLESFTRANTFGHTQFGLDDCDSSRKCHCRSIDHFSRIYILLSFMPQWMQIHVPWAIGNTYANAEYYSIASAFIPFIVQSTIIYWWI